MGVKLNMEKTGNLAFSPFLLPRGVFRRTPEVTYPNTGFRQKVQYRMEEQIYGICREFGPFEEQSYGLDLAQEVFPASVTETVRVPGVLSDQFLSLDERRDGVPPG